MATVPFGVKVGQPVGQGAMPTALLMTRTISAMATAALANSRRVSLDGGRLVQQSGLDWKRDRSQSAFCLHWEPKLGRRQAVKAEAAKRGRAIAPAFTA